MRAVVRTIFGNLISSLAIATTLLGLVPGSIAAPAPPFRVSGHIIVEFVVDHTLEAQGVPLRIYDYITADERLRPLAELEQEEKFKEYLQNENLRSRHLNLRGSKTK